MDSFDNKHKTGEQTAKADALGWQRRAAEAVRRRMGPRHRGGMGPERGRRVPQGKSCAPRGRPISVDSVALHTYLDGKHC